MAFCGTMGCTLPNLHAGLCNCVCTGTRKRKHSGQPSFTFVRKIASPPKEHCSILNHYNGRILGTRIKSEWSNGVYCNGTVVRLVKFPFLMVKYDDDGCEYVIDPEQLYSVIMYRPPRIGKKYQVDIPAFQVSSNAENV